MVVSGFHATLLLKSFNQNYYCSSRGRKSNVRALHLNFALDPHELIQFQAMASRLIDLETKITRLIDLETKITTVSGEVQTLAAGRQ